MSRPEPDPRQKGDLLDLLEELQALDKVPRLGYAQRGVPDPESVSEHSFHVVFLVWALSTDIPDFDRFRAVEIALIHDLAEVRFGDLPRTAAHYLPPGAKDTAELTAVTDLLAPLGSDSASLLREYQERRTPEAHFVSVCDKLQLLIKAGVYRKWRAGAVDEFLDALDSFDDGGFEPVRKVVSRLRSRREERD